MIQLPPGLEGFAGFLETQPETVRGIFYYCLCLMVEADRMRLVETTAGDMGEVCVFETLDGRKFAVPRPALGAEAEAAVLETLREILRDEGAL